VVLAWLVHSHLDPSFVVHAWRPNGPGQLTHSKPLVIVRVEVVLVLLVLQILLLRQVLFLLLLCGQKASNRSMKMCVWKGP